MSHLNLSFGYSPDMKQQQWHNHDNVRDKVLNFEDNHNHHHHHQQGQDETLTVWEQYYRKLTIDKVLTHGL